MYTLQRKSLAQEVADALQERIQKGIYAIQEKLPTEPDLMKQFGVGRSTVREAIKLLANSGYVSVQQGLGTFVVSNSGNDVLDATLLKANFTELLEVRQLLEVKIVEKATLNRTQKSIAKMSKLLEERLMYAREGNIEACIQADIAFHVAIAESCGNDFLYELYRTTSEHISKFFMQQYKNTAVFVKTQPIHEELLLQIKERNPSKALKIIHKIIGTI
jgi:DNA-binding FadR family transcriptional regulator